MPDTDGVTVLEPDTEVEGLADAAGDLEAVVDADADVVPVDEDDAAVDFEGVAVLDFETDALTLVLYDVDDVPEHGDIVAGADLVGVAVAVVVVDDDEDPLRTPLLEGVTLYDADALFVTETEGVTDAIGVMEGSGWLDFDLVAEAVVVALVDELAEMAAGAEREAVGVTLYVDEGVTL